jgi:hypothetical protein
MLGGKGTAKLATHLFANTSLQSLEVTRNNIRGRGAGEIGCE